MSEPLNLEPIKARLECGYTGLDRLPELIACDDIDALIAEVERLREMIVVDRLATYQKYGGAKPDLSL